MVSSKESQFIGLCVSLIVGAVVGLVVWWVLVTYLDFWYIGDISGLVASIILAFFAAFGMFTKGLVEIPLYWVGVSLFLGNPTGKIYQNGKHWICLFFGGMQIVPGPDEKYALLMPEEKINSQDGTLVFFGVDENPNKRNRIQYSVTNPFRYIAMDNPEDELKEAYLEEARLFFGQAARAIGVKNEKTLFSDFIVLPSFVGLTGAAKRDAEEKHRKFKDRLGKTMFTGRDEANSTRLFNDDSVTTIMDRAGNFLEKAAAWGIGNIVAFTPNVRENPEAEQAEAAAGAMKARMAGLATEVSKINELTGQMKATGVSPDLAMSIIAGMNGQDDIKVENKTVTVSGFPEVLKALGELAINKLIKP